ncbi:MAG: S-layer homology domain-containing protein, partial [Acidaminococcaceae bacterium]|nr:S-layer homology domain-containing protein [Acidaminococcaceae bacterium]
SGTAAEPVAANPFTDTSDPEVLKAFNLGVTNGKGADRFDPDALINREEAAAMLTRVYKKLNLEGWTLAADGDYKEAFRAHFTMPEPFADDADISSWARDSVYFMAANGIVNGVGDNHFAPKLVSSGEETLNYATREQALLMSVRTVKNLG